MRNMPVTVVLILLCLAANGQVLESPVEPPVKSRSHTRMISVKEKASIARVNGIPKISPKVRELALRHDQLPVFIILRNQPQRAVVAKYEMATRLQREFAQDRYRSLSQYILRSERDLNQAQEEIDLIEQQTRRESFREIHQIILRDLDNMEAKLKGLGATNIQRFSAITMLSATIPSTAISDLEKDPAIVEVVLIETHTVQLNVSAPSLGATTFWNAGFTGTGQSVAILDSGLFTSHPAFTGKSIVNRTFLSYGQLDPCFADSASSSQDNVGHGTHVAGIVASQGAPNWLGYQGVAKGITTIYNYKVSFRNICEVS